MKEAPHSPAAEASDPPAAGSMRDWVKWAHEAMVQKKWDEAQRRWSKCMEKFGPHSKWLERRAHALARNGQFDEAENILVALLREGTGSATAIADLADIALRRNDRSLARQVISSWRGIDGEVVTPAIAKLLLRVGDAEQSHAMWEQLVRERPDVPELHAMRIRAAIEARRNLGMNREEREALAGDIRDRLLTAGDENMNMWALSLYGMIEANSEAAGLLRHCVATAQSLGFMTSCFRHIPVLIERSSRGALWEILLDRVQRLQQSDHDSPAARELELCILLALGRVADFCARVDATGIGHDRTPNYLFLRRVRERLGKPRREIFLEPKVFGIGLTKTGTTSLHAALMQLGVDSAHWTNPLTCEVLSENDIFLFGASSDISVAQDFEKLYYLYPNARFIWTQRPFESWRSSFENHHARYNWARSFKEIQSYFGRNDSHYGFSSAAAHFGLYLNAHSLSDAYRTYDRRVRGFFSDKAPGRLLELNVFEGQGWPELCAFLGVPAPDLPFPHANKSQALHDEDPVLAGDYGIVA